MDRVTQAFVMLVGISAIVIVTLVLWRIEKARHWRAVRSAIFKSFSSDGTEQDESEVDPYDVGMNDKDIL